VHQVCDYEFAPFEHSSAHPDKTIRPGSRELVSPDGKFVVTASADKTARLWNAATGQAIGDPAKHDDDVLSAEFSPDGRRIVTISWDTVRIWDVASLQ
jgi:WD40 repeat protein